MYSEYNDDNIEKIISVLIISAIFCIINNMFITFCTLKVIFCFVVKINIWFNFSMNKLLGILVK